MKEGERFLSEREIMEYGSYSRATAREALQLLEAEGFIVSKPGPNGGTFVESPSPNLLVRSFHTLIDVNQIELAELAEMRIELEVTSAALAAQRATEEEVERIRTAQRLLAKLAKERAEGTARTGERHITLDTEFHMSIAAAAHNRALLLLMQAFMTGIYEQFLAQRWYLMEDITEQAAHAHQRIVEAIEVHDPDAAVRRMRRHLEAFGRVPLKPIGGSTLEIDSDQLSLVGNRSPTSDQ